MSGGVLFYGDPHGEWRPLLRACEEERPDGVVLMGDCCLARPLREQIGPLFDAGIPVRWIPGNHDTDAAECHDRLWEEYPEGNLHARWEQVGGLLVGGLGGVFKGRVWYPRAGEAEPVHATRRDCMRRLGRGDRWRGGLPLHLRDAIFPEDAKALDGLRLDVLATHEGPSCHRHGFYGIDAAAASCRARLVVHGHHHESYVGATASGIPVRGLAKAEAFRLRREDLA